MSNFSSIFRKRTDHFQNHARTKLSCLHRPLFRALFLIRIHPFLVQLCYFLTFSLAGFLALKLSMPTSTNQPKDLDMFFTSVSATTISSMSTVEMEGFSNNQLTVITILMLVGGEVFTSMLGLHFLRFKLRMQSQSAIASDSHTSNQIELDPIKLESNHYNNLENGDGQTLSLPNEGLKYNSIKLLCYVVMGYLVLVHAFGSSLVLLYISSVPSAGQVLRKKGIQLDTFSVFTTVSTFANCGFVPTNENMVVFKENSGLLLLLIPQMLMGNTLYAPCLRLLIWVLEKGTGRLEFGYMLRNRREMGYGHLLSTSRSCLVALTALAFVLVQLVMFCSLEWSSGVMDGLGSYQKLAGALFQTVNSRHTGESVFDLSLVSPAILVLFTLMMYLPPYTTYIPRRDQKDDEKVSTKQKRSVVQCLIVSQVSYLVIFVILICITERDQIKQDPLNFTVFNITLEVISAYGNVGFSSGYSCKRQLKPQRGCKDMNYGLVGRWSWKGKMILIIVMFFGRLKKFSMTSGQAWNLS